MRSVAAALLVAAFLLAAVHPSAARQGRPPKTGAYSNVPLGDSSVKAVAAFAVAELNKTTPVTLVKIQSARRQVVAGMNYDLRLRVRSGRRNRVAHVIVWHKLDGSYVLTSTSWTNR